MKFLKSDPSFIEKHYDGQDEVIHIVGTGGFVERYACVCKIHGTWTECGTFVTKKAARREGYGKVYDAWFSSLLTPLQQGRYHRVC